MKKIKYLCLFLLSLVIFMSCKNENQTLDGKYEINTKYKTELLAEPENRDSFFGFMTRSEYTTYEFLPKNTFIKQINPSKIEFQIENKELVPENFESVAEYLKKSTPKITLQGSYKIVDKTIYFSSKIITFEIDNQKVTEDYSEYASQTPNAPSQFFQLDFEKADDKLTLTDAISKKVEIFTKVQE